MNIDGGLDAWSQMGAKCCPREGCDTDTILVLVRRARPGTLKRWLFGIPKGVSLRGSTVYVVRINKLGQRRMAMPCATCRWKLVEAGVKRIIYTNDIGGWDSVVCGEL